MSRKDRWSGGHRKETKARKMKMRTVMMWERKSEDEGVENAENSYIYVYHWHFVQMRIENVEFKHVKRCIKAFAWIESDSEKPYDCLRHIKYTRSFSQ